MAHAKNVIVLLAVLLAGECVLAADPKIINGPSDVTVFVDENTPIGTVIYDVDAEIADGKTLEYKFIGGGPGKFIMNINNGELSVSGTLDFEDVNRYQFIVRVTETGKINGPLVGFVVNILPLNKYAPEFTPKILRVNISETSPSDSVVADLTCIDIDNGTNPGCTTISILFGDDTIPKFKVVNNQILTTSTPIDYDTMTAKNFLYKLVVIATDTPSVGNQRTGTTTVLVNVVPVNEYDPSISGQPIRYKISESTQVGTEVLSMTATDNDAGTHGELTYQITGGNSEDAFFILKKSGKIHTKKRLDFERTPSYSLTVEVKDGGSRTSTAVVDITVTDVNDTPPVCSPDHYKKTVDETLLIGSTVLTLSCSDEDAGTNLGYTITSGESGDLEITPSGAVRVKRDLGYDQGLFAYLLNIEVTDTQHTTSVIVLINLNPVNEYPPLLAPLSVIVSEDTILGTEIASLTATDRDASPNNVLSFEIVSVQNAAVDAFLVDSVTGKIYLTHYLDFESIPVYKIVVIVDDGGTSKGTGTVTVSVRNINDNAPYCPKTVFNIMVSELTGKDSVIIPDFGCSDRDLDVLYYSLNQIPSDNTFDVITGQLKLKGTLDYETTPFYSIEINIGDGNYITKLKVAVNVINENEGPPQFINSDIRKYFREDTDPGTVIAILTATDPDNGVFTYNFRTTYQGFILDSKSGEIILTKSLDREKTSSHELNIVASDGTRSSTATVQISVLDVNERPRFSKPNYVFSVAENTLSGQSVGKASAIDADTGGTNGLLRHNILSGNEDLYFQIDPTTGEITVATPPDFENAMSIVLVIQATDQGFPSTFEICTVTINILDVNDNSPAFASSRIRKWISEDASVGLSVIQIFATDTDSSLNGNNKFTFISNNAAPFQIDSDSGIVTVRNSLDRETTSRYDMVITAVDRGTPPLTGFLTLEIFLTDVNDNAPFFIGTYDTSIPEDVLEDTIIFVFTSDDIDEDGGDNFNYTILSGNLYSSFKLDSSNGLLQVASNLNRELVDKFELVIQVTDSGIPSRSTSVTATINIKDVNDEYPVFEISSNTFSVKEHTVSPTVLAQIKATDSDEGFNAKLKYSIATNWKGASGMFGINDTSGEIYTVGDFDREVESEYLLWVRVQDHGSPPRSAEVTVNITIEDLNDNTPIFGQKEYSVYVLENLDRGSKVLSTGAVDSDEGLNGEIKYELDYTTQEGLLADNFFGVRSTSGDVILKRRMDRETYDDFTFTVIARDSGSPPQSSKVNVTIYVLDVNDNRPQFSPDFYNFEASLTDYCDASITVVTAVDSDLGINALVTYSIPDDNTEPFLVDDSGNVKANAELKEAKYIIEIMSSDKGDPEMKSLKNAIIRIDTFKAENIVITFYLDMTLVSYLSVEEELINHIQEVLRASFPTAYVKRWCVEDNVRSVLVHVYAVKSDITENVNNLHKDKKFVTNGEFINLLQLNPSEIPTVTINEKSWDKYRIEKVVPFGEKLIFPTPAKVVTTEEKDDLGLILGIFFGLLVALIAAIIILYLVWRRKLCRKKKDSENTKRPRVQIIEIRGVGRRVSIDEESETTDNKNPINKTTTTTVSVVTPFQLSESKLHDVEKVEALGGPLINVPSIEKPVFDGPSREVSVLSSRQDFKSVTLSPSLLGNTMSNASTPLPTKPALHNPNRGRDFVTGWVFEEDPETQTRKWVRTPDGDPIFDVSRE
ncbi:protocadherin Fat 4-like [Saccostrea echinata]|uniref:protocadherin Fat 4-like n=1 Tax=Saccostrea echinata TaxID=191078 RepID=UPI002A7FB011|nr:protocadherin Fat 4-like [Saccostrea echinata]